MHYTFIHYLDIVELLDKNNNAIMHISYTPVEKDVLLNFGPREDRGSLKKLKSEYYKNAIMLLYDDSFKSKLEAINFSLEIMQDNKVFNITGDNVLLKNDRIELYWQD
jgi:hypothetical protein